MLILLILFIAPILAYNPYSESLKDNRKASLTKRLNVNKGTLILGVILISIYTLTMNADYSISEKMIYYFGLNEGIIKHLFLFQIFTSVFIHFDLFHLCSNLFCLALLSSYERRVGITKFLVVFIVSGVFSSIVDCIFITEKTVSLGASAGICGLVSGYFIDYPQTSWKEWTLGLTAVLIIIGVVSFLPEKETSEFHYKINWLAHFTGAIFGGIFIQLINRRKKLA